MVVLKKTQEMHDNGWDISLQQPGNIFGDHSLIS